MRNGIRGWLVGVASVAALSAPMLAGAQAVDSSRYVAAQQMVANGDAARGRKLVDSLLSAAPAGSPQYAEGLYWRATLATNARNSEHDYRQIVVDYPLSPRVPDALLRMGELEAQRGDREAALQHFKRLTVEHPESPLRAEANYWIAKTYLEKNDAAHGCTANADALAQVSASNIELRNRIDYQQQACRGVAVAAAPTSAPPIASVPAPVTAPAESATAPREVPVKTAPVASSAESTAVEAPAAAAESTASEAPKARKVVAKAATSAAKKSSAKSVKAAPKVAAAKSATSAKKRPAKVAAETTAEHRSDSAVSSSARSKGGYAVQVAAYSTRAQGDALVAKLRGRGYDARVDGSQAPYRVRIGHYSTHAAAAAELTKLKAKKMDGFVTEP